VRSRVQISARRPAIVAEILRGFLSHSRQIFDSTLKLGHGRFLTHPLQLIIRVSPFIRRCIVLVTETASLNKLKMNYKCGKEQNYIFIFFSYFTALT
jgi:hypothetical protein